MFTQQDSGQVSGASGSQPGSTSTPGVQPNSVDPDALLAALENNPKLAALLDRKLQSIKDQRFAKQEKQLSAFQEKLQRLEELQKSGMSKDQALSWMELEARLDSLSKQSGPQEVVIAERSGNAVSGSGDVDVDAFLKAVGIDPTDPDVTALYKSGSVTPDQLVQFVTRKKSAPPASAAQAAPASNGIPNQETLEEQYTKARSKLPPGSPEIFELRRQYRKMGLDV